MLSGASALVTNISGGGVINVAGTLNAISPSMPGYSGPLTLQIGGTILADGSLGVGYLVLEGGDLQAQAPVNLVNSVTLITGPVLFIATGSSTLAFQNLASVPTNRTVLLNGTLALNHLLVAAGAKLEVGGIGIVSVKPAAQKKNVVPLSTKVSVH